MFLFKFAFVSGYLNWVLSIAKNVNSNYKMARQENVRRGLASSPRQQAEPEEMATSGAREDLD